MLLRLRPDKEVALEGASHHACMLRPPDVVGKVALGDLVAGKTGLNDARTVVDDDRLVHDYVIGLHCRGLK